MYQQPEESQLTKRFKSFAWRTGILLVTLIVDFTLQNLGLFNLPDAVTLVLGMVLGEVSKYLNTHKV